MNKIISVQWNEEEKQESETEMTREKVVHMKEEVLRWRKAQNETLT